MVPLITRFCKLRALWCLLVGIAALVVGIGNWDGEYSDISVYPLGISLVAFVWALKWWFSRKNLHMEPSFKLPKRDRPPRPKTRFEGGSEAAEPKPLAGSPPILKPLFGPDAGKP